MFDYIREASTPGSAIHSPHFNLLLLDLKIRRLSPDAKHTAGVLVADRIIERLFGPIHATSWSPAANESLPRLRLVIGLELTADRPFVAAMIERLMDRESGALLSRIGFDVSGNEKVHVIEHLWQHVFRGRLNVWQGDGITNCLSLVRSSNRLKQLIAMREQAPDLPYLAKVYHWTIDSRRVLKDSLRLRVDGVITNDPSIVLETLADPEFRNEYHMARYEDDPFCVVRESQLQALRIGPPEPMSHTHDQQSLLNQLLLNDLVEHSALPSESKPNTHSMSLSNESPTLAPPLSPSAFPSSFESTTESEISNNEHVHKHHRPHHQHHSLHPQRKKPSSPALNQAFESDNLIRTAYGNDFKRSSLVDFNLLRFVQLLRQLHSSSYRPPSSSSTPFAALRFPNGGHVPLHQRLIGSPSIWHSRPNPNRMSDSWPSWAGSSSSSPLASIASLQNDDLVSVMHALQSSLRTLPTSRSVNATSRSSIETHAWVWRISFVL